MKSFSIVLFALALVALASWPALAQRQMLLVKGGKIIARYNPGEDIFFVLKDDKQIYHSDIISIRDFDFITIAKDTIPFTRVAKIKFRNAARKKGAYSILITGASLLALSYALEPGFGESNRRSVRGVRISGIYGLGFGALIFLTWKSTVKLDGHRRLMAIKIDSPLYR